MIGVTNLSLSQGAFRLHQVSFEIPSGSYAVMMGRTGSGKTTLLEAICGLRPIDSGSIWLQGVDATRWPVAARGIGYVPQDAALFTMLTVREHLEFALHLRRAERSFINQRVNELAQLLEIESLLDRYPQGLSGGEAQRVSLGRALAFQPAVLLLDEPLGALDDVTRRHMMALLRQIHNVTQATVMHVTHQWQEAQELATLLLDFQHGQVVVNAPQSMPHTDPLKVRA